MVFGLFEKKGKMEIKLDKMNYELGETIEGELILKMEKPIEADKLRIKITAIETKYNNLGVNAGPVRIGVGSSRRNKPRKEKRTVFSFEQELDGNKTYSGESKYPFKIKLPKPKQEKEIEGTLGTIVNLLKTADNKNTKWKIEGALDIPQSTDVNKKIQINVV